MVYEQYSNISTAPYLSYHDRSNLAFIALGNDVEKSIFADMCQCQDIEGEIEC